MVGVLMSKLGRKVLGMFFFVASIAVILCSISYVIVFKYVLTDLSTSARTAVQDSLKSVDADKLQTIVQKGSSDCSEYKDVLDSMIKYKALKNVTNLYTFGEKENGSAFFIVDASSDPAGFGEKYDMEKAMAEAFKGNTTVEDKPSTDKWGTYISAFAPIKDSSGKVVAIVGADEDISIFINIEKILIRSGIVTAAIFIILSLIAVFIFSRKLQHNMKSIQLGLDAMGDGDLSGEIQVKSKDEIELIAKSINEFNKKISSTISTIKENTSKVNHESADLSAASEEVAASSENVSMEISNVAGSVSNQTLSFDKISETVAVFGQKINDIANSISDVDESTQAVNIKVVESNEKLQALMSSSDSINTSFSSVIEKINNLDMNIDKINEISNLISGIADQTNLLALNAAIEAARAGESGRGFAVVADEVRKLAEQSKDSSENIAKLLSGVSSESSAVVTTAEKVSADVNAQLSVISESIDSFKHILTLINTMLPKINQISESIFSIDKEKDSIIESIDDSLNNLKTISTSGEEISALTEELNAATEEISASLDSLRLMVETVDSEVNYFKTSN
jgi:methyl-accepting chemotaxis protein